MNKIQNTEKKLNLNAILKSKNEKIIRKDKVTKGNKTKTPFNPARIFKPLKTSSPKQNL